MKVSSESSRMYAAAMLIAFSVMVAVLAPSLDANSSALASSSKPSASKSPTPKPSGSASPKATSSASPQSSASPTASAAPSTSFEATMLAYQAAADAARDVSTGLYNAAKLQNGQKLLILTPTDVAAFSSLRVILQQGYLINAKLTSANLAINKRCIASGAEHALISGPLQLGATTASAIAAWINVVSSLTQVKESTTDVQVPFADDTLIHFIAAESKSGSVVVPSVLLPGVNEPLSESTAPPGTLAELLSTLDTNRNALDDLMVSPGIKNSSLCKPTTDLGKSLTSQTSTLDKLVDAFESAITSTSLSGSDAASLSQILYADHIVSTIDPDGKTPSYKFAVVHAALTGGTNLTKQTTMLGTRQYYSGGIVATYALFLSDGTLQCMGTVFGYRGFIAAGDIGAAIQGWTGAASTTNGANKLPDTAKYISSVCATPAP